MAAAKKKKAASKDARSDLDRLIDAALDLAAEHPWQRVSLAMIAEEAGIPIGRALSTCSSRLHLLKALGRRINTQILNSLEKDPLDGSTKDKLFDILMRRFDQLDGRQAAIRSIVRGVSRDPLAILCLGPKVLDAMAVSLQAAGVSSEGCKGTLRAKVLMGIYLNAARVWLTDEDPGLSQTMSVLDKGLSQAEKLAGRTTSPTD